MRLTEQEIEQAAKLLCEQNLGLVWNDANPDMRKGLRKLARELAEALGAPRSPEAVKVFMTWMGDPNARLMQ